MSRPRTIPRGVAPPPEAGQAITVERVERALMTVAYIVARHGPVYAPIFDRLERELAELRAKGDPVERARRYLAAHAIAADAGPRALTPSPAGERRS